MTERVNFILAFNGVTYRFASMLVGDDLLCAVKTKVVAITNCKEVEMYWRDEESDIVLETIEDLATAIDYATVTRRKPSKTPCVTLIALVPALPADEEKAEESTTTSFLDDLLSGIQTVTITEPVVAEPWQEMFSPPRIEKEKGGELKGKLQRMSEMRKEAAAAAAEVAAAFERDQVKERIAGCSLDLQGKRSKSTIEEQKRVREDSIRFLADDFPERYSMAAAAVVNSESRMMTRKEMTEWAKKTFPAFKTLGVRYSDDIRKSLRNGDCFVKVSRLAKEKDEKRLWTINPKYVNDEQMKRECAKNVAEKSKREENNKNADAASSALQREGVLTSPTKKEAASVPAHMSGKEGDITAAERKKVKCITDWAQPVASAAAPMVECIPKVAQKHHKNASATRLTVLQEGVLRLPMKKEAIQPPRPSAIGCDATPAERKKAMLITDWAQPVAAAAAVTARMGGKECDITPAERKKARLITDWAKPVAAAAAPKAERAAKATQEHKKNAAAARLTLQHEGVLRSPMKKEKARMGGKILLDITAAERIVKKTRTITDWAHPVAAAVAPMVECLATALQQEAVLRSPMKKEKPNPKAAAIDSALRKETPVKTRVFISYRRKSGESLASLVRVLLELRGYEALMVTDKWDAKSLEGMIKSAQHFIAVLTQKSLHDFNHGDRFHKELRCAFAHDKSIIPMFDQFFEFPDDEESIPQDIRKIASLSGVRWVHAYQEQCMNHVDRKMRSSEKAVVPIASVASPDAVAVKMPLPAPVDSLAKPTKEKVVKEEDDERTKSLNVKVYVSYRRGPDDELASLVKAHLIQRGYEDFVDENDDSEPLASKIQSAAHFIVLLTPFSFEYFKRDSLFSKELQCAVSHKRHPVFIVGKHFEYPERTCSREHPIPQETRKMLEENEKGRYITIKWNNDDQDESMDQLNRMLRNADFGHYYDRLYQKKERKMLMRECDAIRQTFMKDLEKRELAMKEDARQKTTDGAADPIKAEMQQSVRQTFTENPEKREREFKLTIMHESVLPLKTAEPIKAEMQQSASSAVKESEKVVEKNVGVESTQEYKEIRAREALKLEKEIKKTRLDHILDKRIRAMEKHMKRDKNRQMKQVAKAVRKQKAAAAAVVEAHTINAEVQQSDAGVEKEWEEVDEVKDEVEDYEWSHGEEDVVEDEATDRTDESVFGSTEGDGMQKNEDADELRFDEEADDIFEKVSTDCEDEEDEEEFFEKVSAEDSGEEERDHEDEWSCEEVEDADEDHADIPDLSSIADEDLSEDAREIEFSTREEALALKEVAFERRMAEYAVKMEEFEKKMKGLEKRVERIEKKRADDYDTDQEYDDLLGEREAARAALPALREEIQASLRAQAIKYKTKK